MLSKPRDIPEGRLAYNPSSMWDVDGTILWLRDEPDQSNEFTSHLGKSVVRAYIVNPKNPTVPLIPYSHAPEFLGEDPAMTRVTRRLPISGRLEDVWLLSYVDPKPKPDKPNEVESLYTRFWCGRTLKTLEHIADGPEGMKDIRITSLRRHEVPVGLYGRPQPEPFSGNITYTEIPDIYQLTSDVIAGADFIDEDLLPVGSGIWGGVNDIILQPDGTHRLLSHRAWLLGSDSRNRHYEAYIYDHNPWTRKIRGLGVLATADMFAPCKAKDDTSANLTDGVFPGGGYNGTMEYVTLGVRDAAIGLGHVGNVEQFIARRALTRRHRPSQPPRPSYNSQR